ncbi:MAG TPA: hypothetical protein ENJ35_10250, partial [Gammaproteobacteria bacterium]|nr:hypothetical protein [Gammaproteobacteria bacterium]
MNLLRIPVFLVPVVLASLLAACGGSGGSKEQSPDNGLLTGAPDSGALQAMERIDPEAAEAGDILGGVILTRMDVFLELDATVDQVNTALKGIDARIVTSLPGMPYMTVSIPRQANTQAAADLATELEQYPGIQSVLVAREASAQLLPPGQASSADEKPALKHLEAGRFPAAWNASNLLANCEADKVKLAIVDYFSFPFLAPVSNSSPDIGQEAERELPVSSLTGSPSSDGNLHGWQVAATAAAKFDDRNPTGAMPFDQCIDLTLFAINGLSFSQWLINSSLALDVLGPGVIMSQSLGYQDDCVDYDSSGNMVYVACRPDHFGDQPKAVVFTPYQRSQYGLLWKYLTRDQRDSFLSVVAAGNSGNAESASLYAGLGEAVYDSPMAVVSEDPMAHVQDESLWGIPLTLADGDPDFVSIAANDFQLGLLQSLSDLLKLSSLGTARNVLVVGSGDRVGAHAYSSQGGNIMADGANIQTLGSETVSGTSFSAPQVAGLAAYMWSIAPELREGPMEDTVRAITANTRENGFIDAYAAVLSIDEDAGSEPPKAPVREAILDVTGDGFFNQDDLRLFADFYGLTDTPVAEDPDNPGTPSRFDLNGDGLISPDAMERFDLDPENSTHLGEARYGNVSLSIGGDTISLDENQLTDTEILCYYAYSPLYLGDEQTRSTLLPLSICNTDANLGISNLFT